MHHDPDFPLMFGGSGAWQVYAYHSVLEVLSDYHRFSNAYMPQGDYYQIGSNLNQTDPPLHTVLRGVVAAPFKKDTIKQRAPLIRSLCKRSLESVIAMEKIDFVDDLAYPLSTAVICDIMGIPGAVHEKVGTWSKAIVTAGYSEGGIARAQLSQAEMAKLFYGLLAERGAADGQDVLSLLSRASVNGAPLSIELQVGTCMTILLAGHETTADFLSNALYLFVQMPGLWEQLQRQPALLSGALWEVLRLRPSIVSMYRVALSDTHLEGQLVRKGEIVNAWISTANSDPEVFEEPETFNPDRSNFAKVLSFGKGVHHCLGDHLAKAVATLAFELLLSKVSAVEITSTPSPLPSAIVNGFEHFPVSLRAKS